MTAIIVPPLGAVEDYRLLSVASPRDYKWGKKKGFNWQLASEMRASTYQPINYDRNKYALRLLRCAYSLEFLFGKNSEGKLESRLVDAKFCRINICPICHWRWALKWRFYLDSAIDQILQKNSYRFLFLTLTLRNCEISELSSTLAWMSKSWHRLLQVKEIKSNPSIKGIFRTLEISRSKSGQAHPHYHCLICVSSTYFKSDEYYLKFEDYQRIWRDSLQIDYNPSVFINAVKFIEDYEGLGSNPSRIKAKVCEITKYLTKTSDLIQDIDWTLQLADHLFKTRRVSATGIFRDKLRGIKEDELLNITDRDLESLELESLRLYEWQEKLKEYIEDESQRVYAKEIGSELQISGENLYGQFDDFEL